MIDLFPIIKKEVLKMISENKNKNDIIEFINGQIQVFSINKEEGEKLKKLIK